MQPGRIQHVGQYRLRVDDLLSVVFRRTRERTMRPYKLDVGDLVRVEVKGETEVTRDLEIQPDGTITLPEIGQVPAAGQNIGQLRDDLEKRYRKLINLPVVTVTPMQINTRLQDLLDSVDRRAGQGGLVQEVRVTPDGTIALPALASVVAQGLTLDELKRELNHRYAMLVEGVDVQPVLLARAPRFVFVLGEVARPGRYTLEGPTTAMQALALAGGITSAAAARVQHVVIFRRGPDWRMKATLLNLRGSVVSGNVNGCRVDELWVADSDVVLVPKSGMLVFDEYLDLLFTNGIYSVFPMNASLNFAKLSTL